MFRCNGINYRHVISIFGHKNTNCGPSCLKWAETENHLPFFLIVSVRKCQNKLGRFILKALTGPFYCVFL